MKLKELEEEKNSWVPLYRRVYELFINKEITLGAYNLYPHICMTTHKYAKSVVSIEEVKNLLFKGKQNNTVLKYFHELKNHRLIYFEDRTGKSGPFEVLVMKIFLPGGKMTNPSNYFPDIENYVAPSYVTAKSEVGGKNHRLKKEVNEAGGVNKASEDSDKITGNNNDNDKYKDKLNIDISNNEGYRCINLTDDFKPKDWNEGEIKRMASALGDSCLDFYLKHYREGNFWALEEAFIDYQEISPGGTINNPSAWFNKRVQTILFKKKIGNLKKCDV